MLPTGENVHDYSEFKSQPRACLESMMLSSAEKCTCVFTGVRECLCMSACVFLCVCQRARV